ncbi:hypothetical protein WJF13_23380, partial [Salmonella enterica subsp. enterica serovar Corvallis]
LMPHLFAIHLKNQHNRCWFLGCNTYRDKGNGQNKIWIANVTRHRLLDGRNKRHGAGATCLGAKLYRDYRGETGKR